VSTDYHTGVQFADARLRLLAAAKGDAHAFDHAPPSSGCGPDAFTVGVIVNGRFKRVWFWPARKTGELIVSRFGANGAAVRVLLPWVEATFGRRVYDEHGAPWDGGEV
jgi:hypothetical protein